jgi:DNA-binding transcriptional ArsR family regulator
MNGTTVDEGLKNRFELTSGLRLELFYAMRALVDWDSRIHSGWRSDARLRVSQGFHFNLQETGGAPDIWTMCADALATRRVDMTFQEIIDDLSARSTEEFQRAILQGTIHIPGIVDELVDGKLNLRDAIANVPAEKREWLGYIGLFPFEKGSSMVIGLQKLLEAPGRFRRAVVECLDIFWKTSFRSLWERTESDRLRSLEEKERLFESCTFEEFAHQALLRIHVDYEAQTLRAIRGGSEIPFDRIEDGFIIPSMFNDRRYWTTNADETVVYLPYFDPSLSPEPGPGNTDAGLDMDVLDLEIEPVLLFKALGDPTRFSIAQRIACRPMTATDLATELSVSKPTISHHLTLLREAGLIREVYVLGSVSLRLRREVIEQLSRLGLTHLFGE